MDISCALQTAEEKHRNNLEQFLEEVFTDIFLPSHGLDHHRRVWKHAVELCLSGINVPRDEKFAEKLIVACYLHDAGMVFDRGEKHGKQSSELCRFFLRRHNLSENEFSETLEAIANHDDKSYSEENSTSYLKNILNIADDLDAFGFTGIYRYIEIYLERGKPIRELGSRILSNVAGRFKNFRKFYGNNASLINRHNERYRIVEDFCINLIKESDNNISGTDSPHGYLGTVWIIGDMLRKKIPPSKGLEQSEIVRNTNDPVIKWFFTGLGREMEGK